MQRQIAAFNGTLSAGNSNRSSNPQYTSRNMELQRKRNSGLLSLLLLTGDNVPPVHRPRSNRRASHRCANRATTTFVGDNCSAGAKTLKMLIATAILALARSETPVVLLNGTEVWGLLEIFSYSNTPVEAFLGIPYAKPPVGELRFRAPVPLGKDDLVRPLNATMFAPGCMAEFGMFTTETKVFSEDCLYLNIWRPHRTKSADGKAVVVVFHGGGYSAGDGSEKDWRGVALAAAGDVIVVNFNYRLGVFGFLDLGGGNEDAPGHQGHLDQHLLLRWVQSNIRAFGGDPERVTLFGVSAGSFSISAHLLSPYSASGRLFHAAVMDAGVLTSYHAEPVDESIRRATRMAIAAAVNRSELVEHLAEGDGGVREVLKCLRGLNSSVLLDLQQTFALSQTYTFRPTYPNKFFGDSPRVLSDLAAGDFKVHVPIIIGDSAKEGTFLMTERVHDPFPDIHDANGTLAQMQSISEWHRLENTFADDVLSKVYQLDDGLDSAFYLNASADFTGDILFVCPVTNFAERYSISSMVYHYFWTRTTIAATAGPNPWAFGAYHGIPFYHMMGSFFEHFNADDFPPEDAAYSMDSIEMLATFAKTAKQPSFRGVILPAYNSYDRDVLVFSDVPHSVRGHPRKVFCDTVWAQYHEKSSLTTTPRDEF